MKSESDAGVGVLTLSHGAQASRPTQQLVWAKRALDVLLAGAGLLVSMPLWVLIAAVIKAQDGGPIFFRDQRVGQAGRLFGVLKFRTMIPDVDRVFGPKQATEDDPRVTRVGKFLRATAYSLGRTASAVEYLCW